MASIFDNIQYGGHCVAESTLMLATFSGGHFYNVEANADVDNGTVGVLGDYKRSDVWETKVPTKKDKIILHLTAPKIYREESKKDQEESNFYNGKGEVIRAYEVYETDRFTISAEGFASGASPAVGQYVTVQDTPGADTDGESFKLTTAGAVDPNAGGVQYGFVGYIYAKASNGSYRIFVKRNREVE